MISKEGVYSLVIKPSSAGCLLGSAAQAGSIRLHKNNPFAGTGPEWGDRRRHTEKS